VAESTHSRASKAKTEEADAAPQAAEQVAVEEQSAGDAEASGPPSSLPVAQLIENSGPLLGQPSWVAGPAMADRLPDEEITIDFAKSLVQQWLDRPVEVDPATEEA
jgi:hypothetical protein